MSDDPRRAPAADERRLAAIVFTDVVGYSARMQRDEPETIALLRTDFALMRAMCAAHGGEVLKSTGDGLLLCFSSVVQAVTCALEIQAEFSGRTSDALQHRIGIHLGDVFHVAGDVAGDGVNIAARLQTKARPGTVCVSQSVYDAVKGKLPMQAESLGPQQFKNIAEPITVYLVAAGVALRPLARKKIRAWWWVIGATATVATLAFIFWPPAKPSPAQRPPAVPAADKSIAVLPFTNMSDDKDSGFFADGVHEDLLTHLAKIAALKVISRTSVMQYRDTKKTIGQIGRELGVAYVLEGSVRRAGNRVRVTGQLIRAATDEHVWAQPYEGDLTDIFALQTQFATSIAGELKAVLTPQEKSLIAVRPTANPEAYSLYLQARALRFGKEAFADEILAPMQVLLERAVRLDPAFVPGWTELAHTHVMLFFQFIGDRAAHLQAAKSAIDRAVALAPDSPEVHQALGDYHYYCFRDYASATRHYERLLALMPGSGEAQQSLGMVARRQGRWLDALEHLRRAHELDPRNQEIADILASTYLFGGRYEQMMRVNREFGERVLAKLEDRYFIATLQARRTASPQIVEQWFAALAPEIRRSSAVVALEWDWARRIGDAGRVVRLLEPALPALPADKFETCSAAAQLATALTVLGQTERARPLLEQSLQCLEPHLAVDSTTRDAWMLRGLAHALLGNRMEAMAAADHAVALLPESADRMNGPPAAVNRAVVLAWVGRKDEALREIARLVRAPLGIAAEELATSLEWTPLHGDPRFEAICRDPANRAPKF